ncbi:MAG: hypothetical protein ACRENP_24305, partial [Longimicrobiales bacterium]
MNARNRNLRWLAAALIALAVVACDRRETGRDDTIDATPPATMPAPGVTVRVRDVDVGNALGPDKRVMEADEDDEFATTDTIYVSIETEGTAENATLGARWLFEDGQTVEETNQTISPTGAAVHEFHVSKPSG